MISGSRVRTAFVLSVMLSAPVYAQTTPPRLLSAPVPASPLGAQSGGIAALDVTVNASGAVTAAETVQDFAPFGDLMREAVRGWQFEPAREQGRTVQRHVLVLGFFRPPELAVIAPPRPRYKDTTAPPELPWPSAHRAAYPPDARQRQGRLEWRSPRAGHGPVSSPAPRSTERQRRARAWTFGRRRGGLPPRAFFIFCSWERRARRDYSSRRPARPSPSTTRSMTSGNLT
jgi:hypothetical protein